MQDGQMIAVLIGMRKVRAPQGRVLVNGQSRWLEGKCNRNKPPEMV